ncbi:MAG TPA: hypothetical protein ENH34_05505 [Phycisphaerales bacterium]|nr:hypothetical protein [Phycisphaerales bacterium]
MCQQQLLPADRLFAETELDILCYRKTAMEQLDEKLSAYPDDDITAMFIKQANLKRLKELVNSIIEDMKELVNLSQ